MRSGAQVANGQHEGGGGDKAMVRDPRLDPQPGDVLRKGTMVRKVIRIDKAYSDSQGDDVAHTRNGGKRERYIFVCNWRRWAKGAEVVSGGEK